jgi:hypothetical protein
MLSLCIHPCSCILCHSLHQSIMNVICTETMPDSVMDAGKTGLYFEAQMLSSYDGHFTHHPITPSLVRCNQTFRDGEEFTRDNHTDPKSNAVLIQPGCKNNFFKFARFWRISPLYLHKFFFQNGKTP